MRIAPAPVPVAVWADPAGCPQRLVLDGERWRVVDRPTALGSAPRVDGRPAGDGWRATIRRASDGVTEVADLAVDDAGRWLVIHRWR
ncbi:hypothetical protein GCM10022219_16160 [Microbacterium oryzae]|uniref:Uncharacterized protein n=1 Tax=Microbacterium oryzae TaxID=743009 RepID=A0A6I6E5N2_9MICO|nr:hypothetical protein [Microbacterium oryzae]QGU28077.1 hypothetical protein D7D94_10625 [Microbacterium oryzae]